MTAIPPPPGWTIFSVMEMSYAMARDNFPAFVTTTLVLAAPSVIVDALGLGLLGGIVHLVCSVATSICITWGTLQAMSGRKPTGSRSCGNGEARCSGGCWRWAAASISSSGYRLSW